jgi:hypothetical protein
MIPVRPIRATIDRGTTIRVLNLRPCQRGHKRLSGDSNRQEMVEYQRAA